MRKLENEKTGKKMRKLENEKTEYMTFLKKEGKWIPALMNRNEKAEGETILLGLTNSTK